MTNFEKTQLYKNMAIFIDVMNEDELRELATICEDKANTKEQNRHERERVELMKNLQDALTAIQRAGFSVVIQNTDDYNWSVKLLPDDTYSVGMDYVGK